MSEQTGQDNRYRDLWSVNAHRVGNVIQIASCIALLNSIHRQIGL